MGTWRTTSGSKSVRFELFVRLRIVFAEFLHTLKIVNEVCEWKQTKCEKNSGKWRTSNVKWTQHRRSAARRKVYLASDYRRYYPLRTLCARRDNTGTKYICVWAHVLPPKASHSSDTPLARHERSELSKAAFARLFGSVDVIDAERQWVTTLYVLRLRWEKRLALSRLGERSKSTENREMQMMLHTWISEQTTPGRKQCKGDADERHYVCIV